MVTVYADTSALAKLVSHESETDALRRHLHGAAIVSSAIVRVELLRVVLRLGAAQMGAAEGVLAGVGTVAVTRARLDRAGRLSPAPLRSLDALHLATALELRDELDAFVGYDTRLLEAALQHHLPTVSPA